MRKLFAVDLRWKVCAWFELEIKELLAKFCFCRYLASGSDDTTVIIWDPFRHKKLKSIPTTHIGNIFSVKVIAA